MAERIIHATPQEVEALLAGRLTTFWRPVKTPPPPDAAEVQLEYPHGDPVATYRAFPDGGSARWAICGCPFGRPGDSLVIKEAFRWTGGGGAGLNVLYRADNTRRCIEPTCGPILNCCWQSSATMPRWAVRPGFVRPIVGMQVVRVQRISKGDAKAAGIVLRPTELFPTINTEDKRLREFERVWQSRYGTWSENPPVWGITFGGSDG